MSKKSRRRKKKAKRYEDPLQPVLCAEALEEFSALQAIFVEDLEVHEDETGFNLKLVPHPGQAEENFVSITISVK